MPSALGTSSFSSYLQAVRLIAGVTWIGKMIMMTIMTMKMLMMKINAVAIMKILRREKCLRNNVDGRAKAHLLRFRDRKNLTWYVSYGRSQHPPTCDPQSLSKPPITTTTLPPILICDIQSLSKCGPSADLSSPNRNPTHLLLHPPSFQNGTQWLQSTVVGFMYVVGGVSWGGLTAPLLLLNLHRGSILGQSLFHNGNHMQSHSLNFHSPPMQLVAKQRTCKDCKTSGWQKIWWHQMKMMI